MGSCPRTAGPAARSAARAPTHAIRHGDGERSRLLPRDRKLLAAFHRPHAGPAAADFARLLTPRFIDVHRRESPDDAPASRHVSRGPLEKGKSRRIWLPIAIG